MQESEVLNIIHEKCLGMLQMVDKKCKEYNVEYYIAYGTLLGAVRHKGFIPWDSDVDLIITRKNFEKLEPHLDKLPEEYEYIHPSSYGTGKYFDCVPRLNYKYAQIELDKEECIFYDNRINKIDLDFFFLDKTYDNLKGKVQRLELAVLYGLMNAYRHKSCFKHYSRKRRLANMILCAVGRRIPLDWLRRRVAKVASRYNEKDDARYYFISNCIFECLWRLIPLEAYGSTKKMKFENLTVLGPTNPDIVLRTDFGDYMKLPPVNERVPHWCGQFFSCDNITFSIPKTGT